ncbi:hypothetical protein KAE70_03200 [Bartonella henselae]|uniref:hypothetical protein n=1 Tax=Bartonella henselae TaxID=38323 RepID=UPI000AF4B52B|nr:hypothetical protein [Bartonella henselae]UJM33501.1 hypothetical protein KAE70_03200 [Bartonella henselae]
MLFSKGSDCIDRGGHWSLTCIVATIIRINLWYVRDYLYSLALLRSVYKNYNIT